MIRRLVVILLLATACLAQSPSAQPVMDADRAFNQATQADRLEGWMSFMADNVVLFGVTPPVVGKDAVRKFYEPNFGNANFTLQWEPNRGEIYPAGKVGYTTGRWTLRNKTPKGEAVEIRGNYLTVWEKQKDGSWKVIADGGSADPAPAKMP
jgi:ketosteroid isomerase-like protein